MRYLLVLSITLLFLGCNNNDTTAEIVDDNPQYDEYLWHLFYTENDFSTSYAIDKNASINIQSAWEVTKGEGVKVAVIDESFEPTHEDIAQNVILTYNADDESEDVTGSGVSHGNTCAGHVGALDNRVGIIGSAPEVKLILIKYGYSDASILRAFDKAMAEGAKVINCSWGSYLVSQAISDKLREVYARGITVVFAVGNDGLSLDRSDINDESESPYVIGVGASCENNDVCTYSNRGVNIDVLAPGGDALGLLGLDNTGEAGENNTLWLVDNNYSFGSGTSYSTPLVSGAAALLYAMKPTITPVEVRDILISSASKIGVGVVYDEDGFNIYRGYGKVDASKAVERLLLDSESK